MGLSPGTRLGPYEILSSLGAGGMGEVWKARDTRLEREVAIKVLPDAVADDTEAVARFALEAKAIAALSNPNILAIHDFGRIDGISFAVTELLNGQTLRTALADGPLGVRRALDVAHEVAEGLSAAHEKGLIHRDVKPENVFLTRDGHTKLLDFGLVRSEAGPLRPADTGSPTIDHLTQAGTAIGTIAYMSPEQARGDAVDFRTDQFGLGVVLYEMLAGHTPFRGNSPSEILAAILRDEPEPLAVARGAIPEALCRVVERCLAKEPPGRYGSTRDLAAEIDHCRHLPETARSKHIRTVHGERRKATGILAAVVLGAVAIAATLLIRRSGETAKATARAGSRPRIVVLPFENLGSPDDAYFAAGVTEEITSRLASVRNLAVLSRTTATQYDRKGKTVEQIGRDLGVGYVLEGSIRWDRTGGGPGRVRITPQLIRVSSDTHVWSERYDRQLADIFAIQGEVADRVTRMLDVALAPAEAAALRQVPTRDLEAYDLYLRALDLERKGWGPDLISRELDLTSRAVARDPDFAEALALLATQRFYRYFARVDRSGAELERGRAEAERAVALRPDSADTHLAMGIYHYHGRVDYEAALAEFRAALERRPSDVFARYWIAAVRRRQGRTTEAESEFLKARDRDPRNPRLLADLGETQVLLRKYSEAISGYEEGARLEGSMAADAYKAWAYVQRNGDTAAAFGELRGRPWAPASDLIYGTEELVLVRTAFVARDFGVALKAIEASRVPVVAIEWQFQYIPLALLRGEALRYMGRTEAARAAFEEARRLLEPEARKTPDDERLHASLGLAWAGLGRRTEALREGQLGLELMPPTRDAYKWTYRLEDLALIHTMTGGADEAIALLDTLLSKPSMLSVSLLRLDPRWDPLRKNPKFEALIAKYEVKR